MQEPNEQELRALAGILEVPILKDLLRSIFAEQRVDEMSQCLKLSLADDHPRAMIAAARSEAFSEVVGILEAFSEQYGKPEGPEEEEKD